MICHCQTYAKIKFYGQIKSKMPSSDKLPNLNFYGQIL